MIEYLKDLYKYKLVYVKDNPLKLSPETDGKAAQALMELYNELIALRNKKYTTEGEYVAASYEALAIYQAIEQPIWEAYKTTMDELQISRND